MENDIVRMLFLRRQRQKKRWKIKTISGAPPLSFKAKAGALKDYRIYGNTVDEESVGDRTGNLFDGEPEQGYYRLINGEINTDPTSDYFHKYVYLPLINCIGDSTYSLTYMCQYINAQVCFCWYNDDEFLNSQLFTGVFMGSGSPITVTAPSKATRVGITISGVDTNPNSPTTISLSDISNIMLNEGSTPLPYEPYGYKVPVTISNGTDTLTTPIYLPEQIKKVGDEAEYISYSDQKMHRIGAEDIDVTLPELPTLAGTNVLTVGTAVQPSGVEITGRIKKGE